MLNPTMLKFGYPETLVHDFEHWAVLLRPAQVTLGSLVLAARSDSTAFADLPQSAFTELASVVPAIESTLKRFCDYERINYLMLMMIDPNVHFHVIPRYAQSRTWNGIEFPDAGWPGPPELKIATELREGHSQALRDALADFF